MHGFDTSTPVVVLRCSRHGGLGITRTLGRLGVPVYHVDASRSAPAFRSRYSSGQFVWDLDGAPAHESVSFLSRIASGIRRRPILIPTSDAAAMFVAEYAETLSVNYDFPIANPDLIRGLCSKREMFSLARKFGVATPHTVFPSTSEELIAVSTTMQYPVMVKGTFGFEMQKKAGKRIFLVKDRAALLRLYVAHEDWFRPDFALQEVIPGGAGVDWMFNGYFDRNAEARAAFTGCKLRQYPADAGMTSLGECRSNPEVAAIACNIAKACGYHGMLDVDFRYDVRDRQYKVLDINPRVGATFRLFVDPNGMDVVRTMYLDMTGQQVRPGPAPDGRRWCVEDCDLLSSAHALRRRTLSLHDWIASYRGVAECGVYAADDPLPALWTILGDIRRAFDSPKLVAESPLPVSLPGRPAAASQHR